MFLVVYTLDFPVLGLFQTVGLTEHVVLRADGDDTERVHSPQVRLWRHFLAHIFTRALQMLLMLCTHSVGERGKELHVL